MNTGKKKKIAGKQKPLLWNGEEEESSYAVV